MDLLGCLQLLKYGRIQELIAQASNLEHLDASYYRKKSDFGLELSSIVGSPKI